ncbi:MAG: cold shock domain-containing protein [Desulfobulbaceae bacterium]|nr:cold shock domain-containing protein [Desulfobulbaceae bacterium]
MAFTRLKGTLCKWNDGKGYGFITPAKGTQQIFVHISSFDRNLSRRPKEGDTIFYYVATDKDGKTKAYDASIEGVKAITRTVRPSTKPRYRSPKSSGWKGLMIGLIILMGSGVFLSDRLLSHRASKSSFVKSSSSRNETQPIKQSSRFTCSGKTHCSQMTSCDEATFYLHNCPGTKMDGDNDGIPCERQLCH